MLGAKSWQPRVAEWIVGWSTVFHSSEVPLHGRLMVTMIQCHLRVIIQPVSRSAVSGHKWYQPGCCYSPGPIFDPILELHHILRTYHTLWKCQLMLFFFVFFFALLNYLYQAWLPYVPYHYGATWTICSSCSWAMWVVTSEFLFKAHRSLPKTYSTWRWITKTDFATVKTTTLTDRCCVCHGSRC